MKVVCEPSYEARSQYDLVAPDRQVLSEMIRAFGKNVHSEDGH